MGNRIKKQFRDTLRDTFRDTFFCGKYYRKMEFRDTFLTNIKCGKMAEMAKIWLVFREFQGIGGVEFY
jgi:hypothetical protein